jgi:hypothetical protein
LVPCWCFVSLLAGSLVVSDDAGHVVAECALADPARRYSFRVRCPFGQVCHSSIFGGQMSDLTAFQIIGLCFTAFGLGYAGGAFIRITRRAIETLD